MKAFIWISVSGLTENWHNGGGCVVVAPSLEQARAMLLETPGVVSSCEALTDPPSVEYMIDEEVAARAFIFPDAGCC